MSIHHKKLFLQTLIDLEQRIVATDPYDILGASALIRKMFLDDHPLVDQVNREYKIKVTFEVGESPLVSGGIIKKAEFYAIQDGLDPDTASPTIRRKVMS
jgi:hypothetical protein